MCFCTIIITWIYGSIETVNINWQIETSQITRTMGLEIEVAIGIGTSRLELNHLILSIYILFLGQVQMSGDCCRLRSPGVVVVIPLAPLTRL